jgi:hypothetical protein
MAAVGAASAGAMQAARRQAVESERVMILFIVEHL